VPSVDDDAIKLRAVDETDEVGNGNGDSDAHGLDEPLSAETALDAEDVHIERMPRKKRKVDSDDGEGEVKVISDTTALDEIIDGLELEDGAAGDVMIEDDFVDESGVTPIVIDAEPLPEALAELADSDEESVEEVEGPVEDLPASAELYRSQKASKLRLGDILKHMGLVTEAQIEKAMGRQKETRKRLGQILVEDGVVNELDLSKALATKFGVPFLDLTSTRIDAAAGNMIPEKVARKYGAVPVRFLDDNSLLVAMVDPANIFALDDLKILTGYDVQAAIASEEDVFGAISRMHRVSDSVSENAEEKAARLDDEADITDIREATEEAPIVKLVNSVIAHVSRSWPSSTSPSAVSPRMGAWVSSSAASRSTCAWRRCRRSTARRSSCAFSTSPTS
jgi:hypothetical protein